MLNSALLLLLLFPFIFFFFSFPFSGPVLHHPLYFTLAFFFKLTPSCAPPYGIFSCLPTGTHTYMHTSFDFTHCFFFIIWDLLSFFHRFVLFLYSITALSHLFDNYTKPSSLKSSPTIDNTKKQKSINRTNNQTTIISYLELSE